MTRKNLTNKFIAFLLVFSLAYVQTVLINHQAHHNTQQSHHSSNKHINSFLVKCFFCDCIFNKQSEPALLASVFELTIFSKSIASSNNEGVIHFPRVFFDKHTNKGPPSA